MIHLQAAAAGAACGAASTYGVYKVVITAAVCAAQRWRRSLAQR